MEILGYSFCHIATIAPERDQADRIKEFFPQERYQNKRGLRLHKYGAGPFCRFQIPSGLHLAGVYVVTVEGRIVYVGECQDLSERFNARGYGTISPRNCFEGGQPTNCRVNTLILQAAKQGLRIELWFHQTTQRDSIEEEILRHLQPPWNIQGRGK